VDHLLVERTAGNRRVSAGRSLRSYLLLPRPGDLVKAWIFPLGFLLGLAATGEASAAELGRAALVWVCLEFLIYQGRYQWNDIRGHAADLAHPEAASRGRLPGPPERARPNRRASWAVIAVRLAMVGLTAVVVPDVRAELLALTALVWGFAFSYEWLRSLATGGSAAGPPSVSPAIVGVWFISGGGYAVRAVGGLALAIDLGNRPALIATAVAAAWGFGIAFVTIRWSLESIPFASRENGRLKLRSEGRQAREHTLALVRWLPDPPPAGRLEDWRALEGRTSLSAPWNLATLAGCGAAASTGMLLGGEEGLAWGLAAGIMGLCAAGLVLVRPNSRALTAGLGLVALAAMALASSAPRPWAVLLPWTVVIASHLLFSSQSLSTLARPIRSFVA
jgi:hypothetical protein